RQGTFSPASWSAKADHPRVCLPPTKHSTTLRRYLSTRWHRKTWMLGTSPSMTRVGSRTAAIPRPRPRREEAWLWQKDEPMFEGFTLETIKAGEIEVRLRHGGSGPPLLLLHGHPETHVMWHRVAPWLARDFTVIAPDLRGYGASSRPHTTPDHEPYSK